MDDNFVKDVGALARLEIKKLNFPQVGVVVSVERLSDGFIDVQPVVSRLGNDLTKSDYPILRDVPVIFPSTSQSTFQFPIAQGDGVLLMFTQHDSTNYINGVKDVHTPSMFSFAGLHHAVAFVGFNSYLESPSNANNYSQPFDNQSVNIVHNKKTDKEVKISLNADGSMSFYSPSTIKIESKEIIANCEKITTTATEIDAPDAVVNTKDVIVNGLSVYQNTIGHNHNYTDDGRPMVTAVPNTV